MHDLVIRNALICDGTGTIPVHGALAAVCVADDGGIIDDAAARPGRVLRRFDA